MFLYMYGVCVGALLDADRPESVRRPNRDLAVSGASAA